MVGLQMAIKSNQVKSKLCDGEMAVLNLTDNISEIL